MVSRTVERSSTMMSSSASENPGDAQSKKFGSSQQHSETDSIPKKSSRICDTKLRDVGSGRKTDALMCSRGASDFTRPLWQAWT